MMLVSRRSLLRSTVAGLLVRRTWGQGADVTPKPDSAALVRGKSPGLIVHTSDPLQLETPIEMLRKDSVTPAELLFVRNNLELAGTRQLDPIPLAGWPIEFAGLVEFPRTLMAVSLPRFAKVGVEMVLQCSGNGRAFFSRAAKAKGEQWTRGAMGNVRFAGARFADVVDSLRLNINPAARFVAAEGRDSPKSSAEADFEHSLPMADLLERSFLAYEMNGVPIPAIHGGPVRLITPGYYGTMQIKWVSRLRFESHETANHHHLMRYRTPIHPIAPGAGFVNTFSNSEPNWRMKTKCVIFSPSDKGVVKQSPVTVSGVAFGDGTAIETVLVSIDQGANWRQASLKVPESRYAWHCWQIELSLPTGRREIWARAIDAAGRTQPLDLAYDWNPSGYAYHSMDRVNVEVR